MELYNVRDLNIVISKVLYTPTGARCRYINNFLNLNIQSSAYVLIIFSGKQRFLEIGFDNTGVYKALHYIFKKVSINDMIMRLIEYVEAIRK